MRVLITGAAGFIGFSLSNFLVQHNYKVFGIDNFDKYYSVGLKKQRLKILNKNKNFYFTKLNINSKKKLRNFFKGKKIDTIINLAAQAGVRYSIENPDSYIKSNLVGFANILEACRNFKILHLTYASTSSVYSANTKQPFRERVIMLIVPFNYMLQPKGLMN